MPDRLSCGLVLLAAGGSRRMGRPKQLLPIKGQPLLRHMAGIVLQAPVDPVVVVLGAHAQQIEPVLAGLNLHRTINPAWQEGMASSLRVGIEAARELHPGLPALIVALADQPSLTARHLESLIARHAAGGCSIVASHGAAGHVPPVLFGAQWFAELCALAGDAGARELLRRHPAEVATVPLATNSDLDTREDYDAFTRGAAP